MVDRARHDSAIRTVQSCPDRLSSLVDQDASVVVELDNAAVFSLVLFLGAHDNGVSNVTPADFVRSTDRHTATAGLGAKVSLLLHDYNDAVAWWV